MHYLLEQEGLHNSNELDMGIGISFCDLNKMRASTNLGHSDKFERNVQTPSQSLSESNRYEVVD